MVTSEGHYIALHDIHEVFPSTQYISFTLYTGTVQVNFSVCSATGGCILLHNFFKNNTSTQADNSQKSLLKIAVFFSLASGALYNLAIYAFGTYSLFIGTSMMPCERSTILCMLLNKTM